MRQGLLGIQYREEKRRTGTTGMAGVGMYVEMAEAMGLRGMVDEYVGMRRGGQGWRDSDMVLWLVLLNLVGESL